MRTRKKSEKVSRKELRRLSELDNPKVPGVFTSRKGEAGQQIVEKFIPQLLEVPEQEEDGEKLVRIATQEMYNARVKQAENSAGKSNSARRLAFLSGSFQQLLTGGGTSKIGVTRRVKSGVTPEAEAKSKKARKASKNSRKINRGK